MQFREQKSKLSSFTLCGTDPNIAFLQWVHCWMLSEAILMPLRWNSAMYRSPPSCSPLIQNFSSTTEHPSSPKQTPAAASHESPSKTTTTSYIAIRCNSRLIVGSWGSSAKFPRFRPCSTARSRQLRRAKNVRVPRSWISEMCCCSSRTSRLSPSCGGV